MIKDIQSTVVKNIPVSVDTYLMGLNCPEISEIAIPGQFLMIKVADGLDPLLRRPYSISGIDQDGNILLLFKVIGKGSSLLKNKDRGEKLWLLGPLGRGFDLSERSKKHILIGGGIGIAPLLFLSQLLEKKEAEYRFFMGFKTKKDVIPIDFWKLNKAHIDISTDDGSMGFKGSCLQLLLSTFNKMDLEDASIYACGPPQMLNDLLNIPGLKSISVQISLESRMACGLGACRGCVIKGKDGYLRVCKEGPVFPSKMIARIE
ncbi:MAG TPA: dihydroorotate dehydrogenase electron transfer subunit [Desulfobacteraceae bacterium]|nr:dihydroorotate dehydrogenase electron transfer subunit [Desulfobacteraceae bacterium]